VSVEFSMTNPRNNFPVETANEEERKQQEFDRAFHVETYTFDMRKFGFGADTI